MHIVITYPFDVKSKIDQIDFANGKLSGSGHAARWSDGLGIEN